MTSRDTVTLLPGVILEGDLGEKVCLSWQTSPCLELREKWKCIESIGKSKIWTKTSPWNPEMVAKLLPLWILQDDPCPSHEEKLVSNTPTVSSLLGGSTTSLKYKVALAETVFANLMVEHNMPFLVTDHFSEAVKVMFPDSIIAQKFTVKGQKTPTSSMKHWHPIGARCAVKRKSSSCWMKLMTVEMTRCWRS